MAFTTRRKYVLLPELAARGFEVAPEKAGRFSFALGNLKTHGTARFGA